MSRMLREGARGTWFVRLQASREGVLTGHFVGREDGLACVIVEPFSEYHTRTVWRHDVINAVPLPRT